jgi:hypothetical protein
MTDTTLAAVREDGGLHHSITIKRPAMRLIPSCLLAAVGALSCEAAEPDRTIIPLREPAFEGKIGKTYEDSVVAWPKLPTPPEGAPSLTALGCRHRSRR